MMDTQGTTTTTGTSTNTIPTNPPSEQNELPILNPEEDLYTKPSKWDKFLDLLRTQGFKINVWLYTLALLWFLAHPMVSITTGEAKCRGMYIDEHSFLLHDGVVDPYNHQMDYNVWEVENDNYDNVSSVCEGFHRMNGAGGGSVHCVAKEQYNNMHIVSINPRQPYGKAPSSEAIVFVVANFFNTDGGGARQMVQSILHRLSQEGSWISRSIMFVLGDDTKQSAEDLVDAFLLMYANGELSRSFPETSVCVVRQAIVLDISGYIPETDDRYNEDEQNKSQSSRTSQRNKMQLGVYVQGKRGLLPNLDFVSVSLQSLKRISSSQIKIHSFPELISLGEMIKNMFTLSWYHSEYVFDLIGMVGFMKNMVLGPFYPHSSFLDYGIDSLTLEVRYPLRSFSGEHESLPSRSLMTSNIASLCVSLEGLIRALCNLNERLHHSVFMYILPSSKKFVSNGEYIIPCILALMAILLSCVCHYFRSGVEFNGTNIAKMVSVVLISSILLDYLQSFESMFEQNSLFCMVYFGALYVLFRMSSYKALPESLGSTYVLTCLITIYMHVPLALSHYSLALPSILLFSFLLSFVFRCIQSTKLHEILFKIPLLIITFPPISIVPMIFGTYTPYVIYIYTPLHLLLSSLWVASNIGSTKGSLAASKQR